MPRECGSTKALFEMFLKYATQKAVAEALGCSPVSVSHYAKGGGMSLHKWFRSLRLYVLLVEVFDMPTVPEVEVGWGNIDHLVKFMKERLGEDSSIELADPVLEAQVVELLNTWDSREKQEAPPEEPAKESTMEIDAAFKGDVQDTDQVIEYLESLLNSMKAVRSIARDHGLKISISGDIFKVSKEDSTC